MKILIIGGGRQGFQLAKYCHLSNHQVTIIESDQTKVEELNKSLNVKVILGDGTDESVLEAAGAETADIVVAVTNCDQNNLVVCQLAERKFEIKKTLTLVNNPGNEKLFEWLGVNQVISSTSLMLGLIEEEINIEKTKNLWAKSINNLKMHYIQIEKNSPVIDKKVTNITLPNEVILVTILRGDEAIVPRGETKIKAKDTVIALGDVNIKQELFTVMTGKTEEVAS